MFFVVVLSALCSGVLATPLVSKPTPVSVTLYYETLCPDCQQFIPDKLVSTYNDERYDFASLFVNLTLIPYGFVTSINPETHLYRCQHGNTECEGNRFHGCAINYVSDTPTILNYVSCLEKSAHRGAAEQYPIDVCQDKVNKDVYQKILNCYNTEEGWDIFKKNGHLTNSFFYHQTTAFVPYVSFDNKKNDSLALNATEDFRKVLCEVTGVEDKACSDNAA